MIFKNCSLLFGPSHIFQVATWFEKLFPKKILSRGLLVYHCEKANTSFKALAWKDDVTQFLERQVEFEEVDDCLIFLGLDRNILLNSNPSDFRSENCQTQVTNEIILSLNDFAKKERLPTTFVNQWLCALCNFVFSQSQMRHRINQTCKKVSQMKKKDKANLAIFLTEPLIESKKQESSLPISRETTNKSIK